MAKRRTAVADGSPTETAPELNGDTTVQTNGVHTTEAVPGNTTTDTPPEPVNGTRPVETFSVPCGGGAYIQSSIWGKTIQYEGKDIVVYSITLRKSYKDATTGEWKNTNSFRGSEVYCVQHVLARASEWVLNARTTTSSDVPF